MDEAARLIAALEQAERALTEAPDAAALRRAARSLPDPYEAAVEARAMRALELVAWASARAGWHRCRGVWRRSRTPIDAAELPPGAERTPSGRGFSVSSHGRTPAEARLVEAAAGLAGIAPDALEAELRAAAVALAGPGRDVATLAVVEAWVASEAYLRWIAAAPGDNRGRIQRARRRHLALARAAEQARRLSGR